MCWYVVGGGLEVRGGVKGYGGCGMGVSWAFEEVGLGDFIIGSCVSFTLTLYLLGSFFW